MVKDPSKFSVKKLATYQYLKILFTDWILHPTNLMAIIEAIIVFIMVHLHYTLYFGPYKVACCIWTLAQSTLDL